jgi:lysyl-tRNA synthetase class 2
MAESEIKGSDGEALPGENSDDYNELIQVRIQKLKDLKTQGIDVYPMRFFPDLAAREILEKFDDATNETSPIKGKVAGRIMEKRLMGKAGFARLEDASGRIQIYARSDALSESEFYIFKELDIGDLVGLAGETFRTKQGEVTLRVTSMVMLAKCLRPIPVVKEKDGKIYDAWQDKESRYRRRYVDLIINKETRNDFITRSRIVQGIRNFLIGRDFLEVETPMMQSIPGGASARPFITHHNALNIPLYLRVAPELYLKRLIVGGFNRVFELNRNFRNEGISPRHNPEFTMLEIYEAYADYNMMKTLVEELISSLAREILGTMKIQYQGGAVDLTPPWQALRFVDAINQATGADFFKIQGAAEAAEVARKHGLDMEQIKAKGLYTKWKIAGELFENLVETKLWQPTFVFDYPKELSPLAKSHPDNAELVERFEPFIVGREIGNAFTELNDPFDQRARFEAQVQAREAGDEEAQQMDVDYVEALEYGMPPTGGLGIGIDRLVMLFCDKQSIKDTILFPLLKPEKS